MFVFFHSFFHDITKQSLRTTAMRHLYCAVSVTKPWYELIVIISNIVSLVSFTTLGRR